MNSWNAYRKRLLLLLRCKVTPEATRECIVATVHNIGGSIFDDILHITHYIFGHCSTIVMDWHVNNVFSNRGLTSSYQELRCRGLLLLKLHKFIITSAVIVTLLCWALDEWVSDHPSYPIVVYCTKYVQKSSKGKNLECQYRWN